MATREQVYLKAREMVGVPFRHQGRNPSRGLDCVGLCAMTGLSLGLDIRDVRNYSRTPDWTQFRVKFEENGRFLGNRSDDAVPGSMVILRELRWQTHCGIIGSLNGSRTLIHAYQPRGKVVEERLTPEWEQKILGAYLLNGVE